MKKTNDQAYPPLYTGSTTEKRLPSPGLELSAIRAPAVVGVAGGGLGPRPDRGAEWWLGGERRE
ncbi:hypothetical protein, partial [Parabacteroides sp.]